MERASRWTVMAASAAVVLQYLVIAAATLGYPFQLEWMEGGMLDVVARVRAGEAIYVAPSVDYVPHVYPPLWFYVAAATSFLGGVDLVAGRLVSFAAVTGTCVLLFLLVRRETGDNPWAVASVGLFVATYELAGRWFHLARVDSLSLFLVVAGIYALHRAHRDASQRAAIGAGLLLALGVLTKQTAALAAVPLLGAFFFIDARRAATAAGAFFAATASAVLVLASATDGWFVYYAISLPAQHDLAVADATAHLSAELLVVAPALVAAVAVLAHWFREDAERSRALFWLGAGIGLSASCWLAFVRTGSHHNALLPLCAALALLAPLGLSELPGRRGAVAGAFVLVVQLALLTHPVSDSLPAEGARARGASFLRWLADREGETLLPDHRFVQTRVGLPSHGLGMAARDVLRADRDDAARRILERSLAHALEQRRFQTVVLSQEDWLDGVVGMAYEPAGTIDGAPAPVTGWPFRPRYLWTRPD